MSEILSACSTLLSAQPFGTKKDSLPDPRVNTSERGYLATDASLSCHNLWSINQSSDVLPPGRFPTLAALDPHPPPFSVVHRLVNRRSKARGVLLWYID